MNNFYNAPTKEETISETETPCTDLCNETIKPWRWREKRKRDFHCITHSVALTLAATAAAAAAHQSICNTKNKCSKANGNQAIEHDYLKWKMSDFLSMNGAVRPSGVEIYMCVCVPVHSTAQHRCIAFWNWKYCHRYKKKYNSKCIKCTTTTMCVCVCICFCVFPCIDHTAVRSQLLPF